MTAMTLFLAEKCCHLVSAHAASVLRFIVLECTVHCVDYRDVVGTGTSNGPR